MLRLMHAKFALLVTTIFVVSGFVRTEAAWALVKAPGFTNHNSFLPNSRAFQSPVQLPAALDPSTDLGDTSDTTRSGLSRRAMLLTVADDYARSTYVPYVWGGNKIGTSAECQSCRECLTKQRGKSIQRRHIRCAACQQCGMDCSHFVNRIYRDAGMAFPYASTKVLKRSSPDTIKRQYGLVYVGKDLTKARPGDLILKEKHIVMLLQMRSTHRGDILHVSRSQSRRGVGGVQMVLDTDVQRFSGRLVRIFRHELIVDEELRQAPTSSPDLKAPQIDWQGRSGLLVRLDAPRVETPWRPVL
jgi:hypothetical protein